MKKSKWAGAAGLAGAAAGRLGVNRAGAWLLARLLQLPAPLYPVATEQDLPVPGDGGRILLANRYYPKAKGSFPTVLIRSPWGRGLERLPFSGLYWLVAHLFAERGYQVLVQDTRTRTREEGELFPWGESEDGRAALTWIGRQSWFNGRLGMWGASYLGYAQWALAADAPEYLQAVVPVTASSNWRSFFWQDGAFALERVLTTLSLVRSGRQSLRQMMTGGKVREEAYERAVSHLPLSEADRVLTGSPDNSFRAALAHSAEDDPFWQPMQHRRAINRVNAAVHLVGGWHDVFLKETLADYSGLLGAGARPYLTIGPYAHTTPGLAWESIRQALAWFESNLKDRTGGLRPDPVRVYVMPAGPWREFKSWPPDAAEKVMYLKGGGYLVEPVQAADSPPDKYRYDPTNPTPAIGGALIGRGAGIVDDAPLEGRADVLAYTGAPLEDDLEVIGSPRLDLYFQSTLEHTDVFARLCDLDVDVSGASACVCDGFVRLSPGNAPRLPDGSMRVTLTLGPTAYRFTGGHQLRLVIASGAHPRWARNLGTGDVSGEAVDAKSADQTVYHDREHPSVLVLPAC